MKSTEDMTPCALPWAKTCYGVDLQGDTLVTVMAQRTGKSITFTVVDPAKRLLDTILIATSVRASESLTISVTTPFASRKKSLKVLPSLLDIRLPFPLEDCIHTLISMRSDNNGSFNLLSAVARKQGINKKLEELRSKNLNPHVLDHEGLALWTQSLTEAPPLKDNMEEVRAVIYLGTDHSTVAIGKGQTFLTSHSLKVSDSGQLKRFLSAHLSKNDSLTFYWCGPGAQKPDILAHAQSCISLDCQAEHITHTNPETFLCRSVASRAITPGKLRCNFRSGDTLTHPDVIRKQSSFGVRSALSIILSGIFLIMTNLTISHLASAQQNKIDKQFSQLADYIAGHHIAAKGDKAIEAVHRAHKKDADLIKPFILSLRPSLSETLFGIMTTADRCDFKYHLITIDFEHIFITGKSPDWDSCDTLSTLLSKSGYNDALKRYPALSDGTIPFTIGGSHE